MSAEPAAAEPAPSPPSPTPDAGHVAVPNEPANEPSSTPAVVVTVGKAALLHCQDPPAADLKPSKCGEPALDMQIVPKIEQLATCAAAAGVTGRLQVGIDVNFQSQVLKVSAGRLSAIFRSGRRDEKAIEPLLACLRASLKDVVRAGDARATHDHFRYVLFFPVTLTSPAGNTPPPSAPSASEKAVSGSARVEVDTAIVRDAPNTGGQPIGRVSRGTRVTTVGRSGNWFHIRFGEGDAQEGWIFQTNIGK